MAKPPHLPPLPADYEQKPAKVMTDWSRPFNAIDYKVKDGDSLAGLAAKGGIASDALLQYCFHTKDPREVNWYLRMRVGCKEYGPAVKNFAFSSSADPGIIWLPDYVYNRIAKGSRPAAHNYSVPGLFPRYAQKSGNVCWGAAVANIYDWKKKRARSTATKVLAKIGARWEKLYNDGDYLRGPQFADLAVDAGLKEIPLGHLLNDKDWMDILQNRGAMLMLQESVGSWTHWIVLVGYEYSAKHELEIDYIDPADGRKWGEPAAKLYDKCLGAKTAYGRVYAY
ncbi:MAG: hypothetical protein KDC27_04770 [Acidobacteria bacterium]|nr:hypothetical protein [Acidobacteriota bacterium]